MQGKDSDILRDFLSLALDLLKDERTRARGDSLYEIHKYLEDRLQRMEEAPDPVLQDLGPSAGVQGLAGQVFHFHTGCTVHLTVNG